MKEKNLFISVSENNRGSFDLFYNIYYEQVFRFAYYLLKDKEACREVVSDVFFSIWQSRRVLKDVVNMETYLYIVVRNECKRYTTKTQRHTSISIEDIPVHLENDLQASAEDELVNKEIEKLLTQAINELPEKCRIIFLMVREEGMKPKQIAEILSIKESTVRVQMKIAIEKIVETIKPHFPDITLSMLINYIFTSI